MFPYYSYCDGHQIAVNDTINLTNPCELNIISQQSTHLYQLIGHANNTNATTSSELCVLTAEQNIYYEIQIGIPWEPATGTTWAWWEVRKTYTVERRKRPDAL